MITLGPDEYASDLLRARRFLESQAPAIPGRVILCGVVGPPIYGFAGPLAPGGVGHRDLELKGIYVAPIRRLLGLHRPAESIDRLEVVDGVAFELTLTEARTALDLLLRGHGNLLERILSPLQLASAEVLGELRELARGALSRRFFRHYQGFFRGGCRDHERAERALAASQLMVYRVALTGIHLLRTGECETDLRRIAPIYGYQDVLDLIDFELHEAGRVLPEAIDDHHRGNWPRLASDLEEAYATSPLPEVAGNSELMSSWLVDLRLRELGID